jgi:hypothetical protein
MPGPTLIDVTFSLHQIPQLVRTALDGRKAIEGHAFFPARSPKNIRQFSAVECVFLYEMKTHNLDTMIQMLDGRALDAIDRPESLLASLGSIQVAMTCFASELSKPEASQDAEKLFEILLVISTTAMLAAADHVLPSLEEKGE